MSKIERTITRAVAAALVLGVGGCETPTTAGIQDPLAVSEDAAVVGDPWLPLATWNVYLGGDIAPVLAADFSDPVAVVTASAQAWAQVQGSNMPERAAEVVRRLASEMPAVVGLQEVFQFVELDGSFQPIAPPLDMLGLIQSEIVAQGVPYQVAAVQAGTSAALPVSIDLSTFQVDRWVAFTDRVATLVRDDVDVDGVHQGPYQASLELAPGFELRRGWIRTDISHKGGIVHVINTHLEGQALAPVQSAQVDELLGAITAGLPGTVVLMGDLNSDAAAGPGAPSWTPTYGRLVDAGFFDLWNEARPRTGDGFTCCHDPGLGNP
ncbi:MAG: hypothetical protein HKN73_18950, partial [Gemmatimonadetes bacterium]|nr:hypothetical protein [Gemmatimonadota bacterium]